MQFTKKNISLKITRLRWLLWSLLPCSFRKFVESLLIYIQLYQLGFFFDSNTHTVKSRNGRPASRWGFYTFNHTLHSSRTLFDVDFDFSKDIGTQPYFHIHGDDTRIKMTPTGTVITRNLN